MPSIRASVQRRLKVGDRWGIMQCTRIYLEFKPPWSDGNSGVTMVDLHCDGYKTNPKKCSGQLLIKLRDFPGKSILPDCGCGESGMVTGGWDTNDDERPILNFTWGIQIDGILKHSIGEWKYHAGSDVSKARVMRELIQYGLGSKVKNITTDLLLTGTERMQVGVILDMKLAGLVLKWAEAHGLKRSQAVVALLKLGLRRFGMLGESKRDKAKVTGEHYAG